MSDDFYDLLDVSEDASQDDIKEAFREQVRIYHPDLNDDDRAQAQFTALKKAYDILGDPVERKAYDRLGHTEYVAKRTSGIPSPDLWQTSDDSTETEDSASASTSPSSTESRSGTSTSDTGSRSSTSTSSATTSGTTTSSSGTTTSRTSKSSSSTSTGSTSTGSTSTGSTSSSRSTTTGTTSGTATGSTSTTSSNPSDASADETIGQTSSSTDGGAGATASKTGTEERSGGIVDGALEWWRRQNFGWPLVWTAALTYLLGLVHFGLENEAALGELWATLTAVGADPDGLWATLTGGRHGVDTPLAFVTGLEIVAPPAEPTQWYGLLAGVIGLSIVIVAVNRLARRHDTLGPVSFNELIVVALALAVVTVLVGGPLLTGVVLLPILFGVVVRRTRQLPGGWNPTYAYVLAVSAPAVALAASWAGYGSLLGDLLAFALLGLAGAVGFPLRAQIRARFGR